MRALGSLALIAVLLSRLDWFAVIRLVRGVVLVPLLAGSLTGIASQFLMAERTRRMLRHWGVRLSRASACSVTWTGQFCNNFLPGGMGGDMVKFYRVGQLFPHARAATLVALVADRLMALVALVALSTVALACGDRAMLRQLARGVAPGSWRDHLPAWGLAFLVGLALAACVSLVAWRRRRAIMARVGSHLQSVRRALAQGGRLDGTVASAFLLAVAVHSLGMISALLFARSLAIPLGVGQVFLVWPVVLVAMMMPVSVNGYGLREFILLYYFEQWHLTSHVGAGAGVKESIVALSLLTVVNDLLCNFPGGLLLLLSGGSSTASADAAEGGIDRSLPGAGSSGGSDASSLGVKISPGNQRSL